MTDQAFRPLQVKLLYLCDLRLRPIWSDRRESPALKPE
jgi:hypothetical protein